MQTTVVMEVFIDKSQENTYFMLPFTVPESVSRIDIKYTYLRKAGEEDREGNVKISEVNIIDLALSDYEGRHLGSSGSDRDHIFVSEYYSCPGYSEVEIKPGEWYIVVGAYKIQKQGVKVTYEITYTHKERRLLFGDLHIHTKGSDGDYSVDEIADLAVRNHLDFIFITDHNNYSQNFNLPKRENMTVMPGVEWTHYNGHVNFLGVKKAYEKSFIANSPEEMRQKLDEAFHNGAIVCINHPFSECGFKFGLENVTFDCVEIWNGFMTESNMKCVSWWQEQLLSGRKLPVVGGSDFHRFRTGSTIGSPSVGLYALSEAPSDIYAAIRAGNCFITESPQGPSVFMRCMDKIMGETVTADKQGFGDCHIDFEHVKGGDLIKVITDRDINEIELSCDYARYSMRHNPAGFKFIRVELYRSPAPGYPKVLAMLSNPIYFCEG